MATVVNSAGNANARARIAAGDTIDAPWSFDAADGNAMLGANGDNWDEFGRWHLGIDTTATPKTKGYYDYPFGKGGKLYVSAIRTIRSRSAQEGDTAVFAAAGRLMDEISTPGKAAPAMPLAAPPGVVRKVTIQRSAPTPGADFVMSDETKDRYGEVIVAKGWQLANFKRNPIMLFNHNPDMPIGQWDNVRVEGTQLLGKPRFIPAVSDRTREIQAAYDAGVLRAASVGFLGEREPMDGGGYKYPKPDLVECSLVSTPANPNALQIVKSLVSSGKIGTDTARLICGEHADTDRARPRPRQISGEHAERKTGTSANNRATLQTKVNPMNLSEKIERSQDRINSYRAALDAEAQKVDDEDEDSREAYARLSAELTRKLDSELAFLEGLQRSERQLGETSEYTAPERKPGTAMVKASPGNPPRPFAVPKIEVKPRDYVFHVLTAAVLHHIEKGRRPIHEVVSERYGGDELTHRLADVLLTRGTTVPATMAGSSWADTLIQTAIGDFVDALMPMSVYPGLSERGGRFTFGANGAVALPTRAATPTVGGAFVLDGSPIPVKQGSFNSVTLTPKKMGVITTFTRQIAEHSTPAIEGLLRQGMQEDTSVAIDTVLLDATAASTTRPAGLQNGVSSSVKSSLSGFSAIVGDVKTLLGVLIAANALRMPTWIMNPANVLALTLDPNTNGDFPFAADANRGMLAGYPILASTTQTSGTVMLIDAADFFSATGDSPRFDVSDQAVLHMEDTSPTNIGVSSTGVFPVRSMWQTDSIALRMIMDINWAMRRTGVIAFTTSVNW